MTEINLPDDDVPTRKRRPPTPDPWDDSNPDDITRVEHRLNQFWELHSGGRISTEVLTILRDEEPPQYRVRARVWRSYQRGAAADATGHATRTSGVGDEITATYPQETAETVAIGRALRFLGITGQEKDG